MHAKQNDLQAVTLDTPCTPPHRLTHLIHCDGYFYTCCHLSFVSPTPNASFAILTNAQLFTPKTSALSFGFCAKDDQIFVNTEEIIRYYATTDPQKSIAEQSILLSQGIS